MRELDSHLLAGFTEDAERIASLGAALLSDLGSSAPDARMQRVTWIERK